MGWTEEDGLRFVIVQPQEVCVHPMLYVSDAAHNSLHNVVKGHVRWIEQEVHLGVINIEMMFKTVGIYGLAERNQVDREQLEPQCWALGCAEQRVTGCWARVLDGDRLCPILQVGLEPMQSSTSHPRSWESLCSSTRWSMVSNAADRSSSTSTTMPCQSMACRMSLCTRIKADYTLWWGLDAYWNSSWSSSVSMCSDSLAVTTLQQLRHKKPSCWQGGSSSECSHPSQTSLALVEYQLSWYCFPHMPRKVTHLSDGWAKELPAQRTFSAARLGKGSTHRSCMGMTSAAYGPPSRLQAWSVKACTQQVLCHQVLTMSVQFPQRWANCLNPREKNSLKSVANCSGESHTGKGDCWSRWSNLSTTLNKAYQLWLLSSIIFE